MSEEVGQSSEGDDPQSPGGDGEGGYGQDDGGGGDIGDDDGPPSPRPGGPPAPAGRWHDRVVFAETDDGLPFAFRPREVITTRVSEALRIARELFPGVKVDGVAIGAFSRLTDIDDPILLVEELRVQGIVAQPNHVFFAHPVYGDPVYGDPVYGDPVYGDPVYGDPVYGDPVYGDPVYGDAGSGRSGCCCRPSRPVPPYRGAAPSSHYAEPSRSSALPPPANTKTDRIADRLGTHLIPGSPKVIVLDTGLAAVPFRPLTLGSGITPANPWDVDHPTEDGDGYLDPTAGHGTFIAGIIGQIAPGCEITVHRVLSTYADGDEWKICHVIHNLALPDPHRTILSLSFGGYVLERPHLMARTIRAVQHKGVSIVASAGNDATCRPDYPACLPGVIAVGALCPTGPAPFSNYGDWVDACAPGSNLLSSFFVFNGPAPVGPYGSDPDDFGGWAMWSGTSFSAPAVAGNLARLMMADGGAARAAIERLIDGPSLTRLPYLGTVVDAL